MGATGVVRRRSMPQYPVQSRRITRYCGVVASDLSANAVVGVALDYEAMGQKSGMLMVSASGTAVVLE